MKSQAHFAAFKHLIKRMDQFAMLMVLKNPPTPPRSQRRILVFIPPSPLLNVLPKPISKHEVDI